MRQESRAIVLYWYKWVGQALPRLSKIKQVLLQSVPMSPAVNDIFPKLTYAKHLTVIDMSFVYHNLRLDE